MGSGSLNDATISALQNDYDSLFCPGYIYSPLCHRQAKASLRDDLGQVEGINEFDVTVLARGYGEIRTLSRAKTTAIKAVSVNFNGALPFGFDIEIVDVETGLSIYSCVASVGGDYAGGNRITAFAPGPKVSQALLQPKSQTP